MHGKEIVLRISLQNNSLPMICPAISAYVIRAPKGQELASTNSMSQEGIILDWGWPPNGIVNCQFKIQVPYFHPGAYSITPTLAYEDPNGLLVVADQVENAIVFDIVEEKKVHVVDWPTEFEVIGNSVVAIRLM